MMRHQPTKAMGKFYQPVHMFLIGGHFVSAGETGDIDIQRVGAGTGTAFNYRGGYMSLQCAGVELPVDSMLFHKVDQSESAAFGMSSVGIMPIGGNSLALYKTPWVNTAAAFYGDHYSGNTTRKQCTGWDTAQVHWGEYRPVTCTTKFTFSQIGGGEVDAIEHWLKNHSNMVRMNHVNFTTDAKNQLNNVPLNITWWKSKLSCFSGADVATSEKDYALLNSLPQGINKLTNAELMSLRQTKTRTLSPYELQKQKITVRMTTKIPEKQKENIGASWSGAGDDSWAPIVESSWTSMDDSWCIAHSNRDGAVGDDMDLIKILASATSGNAETYDQQTMYSKSMEGFGAHNFHFSTSVDVMNPLDANGTQNLEDNPGAGSDTLNQPTSSNLPWCVRVDGYRMWTVAFRKSRKRLDNYKWKKPTVTPNVTEEPDDMVD